MWAEDVIDKNATSSLIGSTSSTGWISINVTGTSGAQYNIRTMGTSETDYAVSWNGNGYLVTTTSSKNLKSVTVNAEKTVNVYASNDAYTSGTAPTGSVLASLESNTTDGTKYDFTASYKYLALVGTKSCKVNSISIEYVDGEVETILYTVSIETPANGSLQIKKGETVLSDGEEITAGSNLTVMATPAEGYKFKNWQYKEGEGSWNTRYTANQNYTMPADNVQFRANFEVLPTYTVAWSVNGSIVKSEDLKEGAVVTAPSVVVPSYSDKIFTGWVTTESVDAEDTPSYVIPSGTAMSNVTYYAVFASLEGSATPQTITWNINGVETSAAGGNNVNTVLTTSSVSPSTETGVWTAVASNSYASTSSSKAQLGSGSYKFAGTIALSNTSIPSNATITGINLTATSSATDANPYTVKASVNGNAFGTPDNISSGNANCSWTDEVDGNVIVLTTSCGYNKNIVISAISVNYSGASYCDFCTAIPAPYGEVSFVAHNNDDYWATFTSAEDVIFDGGQDIQLYTVAVEDASLIKIEVYDNSLSAVTDKTKDSGWVSGYYVQANTGVLIYSIGNTPAKYYFTENNVNNLVEEVETAPEYNMLRPASVAKETDGSYLFYKLAYGGWPEQTKLGFWWGEDDGAPFESKAGGVYLAVPANVTLSNMRGFSFDEEGTLTGIEGVKTTNDNVIYNLQGQRVSRLQQGVNIVNGKKVIR